MAVKLHFGNATAKIIGFLMITTGLVAPAVHAAVPDGIADMLKHAVAQGDQAGFEAVLASALATWPKQHKAILKLAEGIKTDWMKDEQKDELAKAKAEAEAKEKASRARGIIYYLDPTLWNGQAQFGTGASSGDTSEQTFSLGLSFSRKFGKEWEHNLNFTFDMARSDGETTRRRFDGQYETLWKPWKKLYLANYAELELDRFSGYDHRITENLGIGYQLIDSKRQSLRFEVGPGIRQYKLTLDGTSTTEFLGRLSGTYEVNFSDSLNLKDRASTIFGTDSTSVENFIQLSARINAHLAARLTFQVNYDSPAPVGTSAWDTATHATLVYGF